MVLVHWAEAAGLDFGKVPADSQSHWQLIEAFPLFWLDILETPNINSHLNNFSTEYKSKFLEATEDIKGCKISCNSDSFPGMFFPVQQDRPCGTLNSFAIVEL